MGRKRNAEDRDSEEEIRRKIRKWERKLKNKTQRDSVYSDNDEINSRWEIVSTDNFGQLHESPIQDQSPVQYEPLVLDEPPVQDKTLEKDQSEVQQMTSQFDKTSSPPPLPGPAPSGPEVPGQEVPDKELDGDILQLLGDAPKLETPLGPPIHKDVANRWQDILAKGLSKEAKEKILQEYLIPSNIDLLLAPALNPEAKAALSDQLVKRDSYLMHKQKQMGIAIGALAIVTNLIIANETSKQKLLKPISDACRVLCDNHFMDTKSRRNLVISSTNTQLKDTLTESVRDKTWLFGENVAEKLKAAKSIQRSGDDLKNQPKQLTRTNNYQGKNYRGRFRPQQRKTDKPTAMASSDSSRNRLPGRAPMPQLRSTQQRNTRRSPPRRTAFK